MLKIKLILVFLVLLVVFAFTFIAWLIQLYYGWWSFVFIMFGLSAFLIPTVIGYVDENYTTEENEMRKEFEKIWSSTRKL